MAERVLLRVGQKLNGMEEGQVGYHIDGSYSYRNYPLK